MVFDDERYAKLMNSAVGICRLTVKKRAKTDEKCHRYTQFGGEKRGKLMKSVMWYMQFGGGKEPQLMKNAIRIYSLVVEKSQH